MQSSKEQFEKIRATLNANLIPEVADYIMSSVEMYGTTLIIEALNNIEQQNEMIHKCLFPETKS